MTVNILFDQYDLPENGPVELKIERIFNINVTRDEAQQRVHNWLVDYISSNIGASLPTLVMRPRPVWRVPAQLSFPRYGHIGVVGTVDVDVETGELYNLSDAKGAIERHAEQLARQLPVERPVLTLPEGYLAADIPTAPKLSSSRFTAEVAS